MREWSEAELNLEEEDTETRTERERHGQRVREHHTERERRGQRGRDTDTERETRTERERHGQSITRPMRWETFGTSGSSDALFTHTYKRVQASAISSQRTCRLV